jgi:hypothetical protein
MLDGCKCLSSFDLITLQAQLSTLFDLLTFIIGNKRFQIPHLALLARLQLKGNGIDIKRMLCQLDHVYLSL